MKVTKPMIERGARALAEAMGITGPMEDEAMRSSNKSLDFEEAAEIVLRAAHGDPRDSPPKPIEGQTTVYDFLPDGCKL